MIDWEYAIHMENDGEAYYLTQAERNMGNPLGHVFEILADAEGKHAELLTSKAMGQSMDLYEKSGDPAVENVFKGLGDFRKVVYENPDQQDVYVFAAGMEQRSIDLYQGMLAETSEEKDRDLLNFLVLQEKQHLSLFEELNALLMRPKEWVEAAEFGRREEY